jgi:hypothetical protein
MPVEARVTRNPPKVLAMALIHVVAPQIKEASESSLARA